jgi:hypothetical protein
MKTFQVWFVNEEVLLIQAEKSNAADNIASFYVGHELVAAFSFDQILGFSSLEAIVEGEDEPEE